MNYNKIDWFLALRKKTIAPKEFLAILFQISEMHPSPEGYFLGHILASPNLKG
jgi:hypothetical protein